MAYSGNPATNDAGDTGYTRLDPRRGDDPSAVWIDARNDGGLRLRQDGLIIELSTVELTALVAHAAAAVRDRAASRPQREVDLKTATLHALAEAAGTIKPVGRQGGVATEADLYALVRGAVFTDKDGGRILKMGEETFLCLDLTSDAGGLFFVDTQELLGGYSGEPSPFLPGAVIGTLPLTVEYAPVVEDADGCRRTTASEADFWTGYVLQPGDFGWTAAGDHISDQAMRRAANRDADEGHLVYISNGHDPVERIGSTAALRTTAGGPESLAAYRPEREPEGEGVFWHLLYEDALVDVVGYVQPDGTIKLVKEQFCDEVDRDLEMTTTLGTFQNEEAAAEHVAREFPAPGLTAHAGSTNDDVRFARATGIDSNHTNGARR